MPATELKASPAEVVKALKSFSAVQLERLAPRLNELRVRKNKSVLSKAESKLLLEINRGVPQRLQQRHDVLQSRRRAGTLTSREDRELLALVQKMEALDVERLRRLNELARLRRQPLRKLMDPMGITARKYVEAAD